MDTVLLVNQLRKSYESLVAVDGIGFSVKKGEVFGLLGHNGAGKTTTIECILGIRNPDSGTVSLLGEDPSPRGGGNVARKRLFAKVGVQFQQSGYQEKLRVGEACALAASLYPHAADYGGLLDRFGLAGKRNAIVNELSGGERQKLSVILALVPEPEVLFLDELTTGLDPQARREIWSYLKGLKAMGVTIILTSHYMDEVEYLCDRIAILRKGRIVAEGTPIDLVSNHRGSGGSGTPKNANLEDVFLSLMGDGRDNEAETGKEAV